MLGRSRARVLETLQTAGTALGVGAVAAKVGLHPNTTRFHLDGLVGQGLAERSTEERDTPAAAPDLDKRAPAASSG